MKRMYPAVFFLPLHFMLLSIISYPLEFVFWDLFWYTKCISNSEKGRVPVGGDYEKGVYNQLMEVMEKLNVMESEHSQDRKEVKELTSAITSLHKENAHLKDEISHLKQTAFSLEEENNSLKAENRLLSNDNERMKRILDNDSSNSSNPPSKDQPGKAPNMFNGRKTTKKKPGAQPGHKGSGLSKAAVEQGIQEGAYQYRLEQRGTPGEAYVTRYRIDLEVIPVATEIRIYAGCDGKFQVPKELRTEVSYGGTVKAIAAFLYSEGVVENDRICTFINSLSPPFYRERIRVLPEICPVLFHRAKRD